MDVVSACVIAKGPVRTGHDQTLRSFAYTTKTNATTDHKGDKRSELGLKADLSR